MHLLYIDDSGDDGRTVESSPHFVLGGLAVADWNWHSFVRQIDTLAVQHLGPAGARIELRGSDMLSGRNVFRSIQPAVRESLFEAVLGKVGEKASRLSVFLVVVHKDSVPVTRNVRTLATLQLYQRFNAYLARLGVYKNKSEQHGMLICDEHASQSQIQALMSVLHSGGVPRQLTDHLIETAFFTDSRQSRMLQVADLLCHAAYRFIAGRESRFFHLIERKIDRDVDRKRLTRAGKPQVVHYGFRYIATAPDAGLTNCLQFKHLALSATTKMPVGSFLHVDELEKELSGYHL